MFSDIFLKNRYNRKESLRIKRRRGLQKEEEEELMELRKRWKLKNFNSMDSYC